MEISSMERQYQLHQAKAMASFERNQRSTEPLTAQKYPIRRFEISIKKFVKVLTIDLERLEKHRLNIERLTHQENWTLLNKEQVNASRTVQQIKANVREIEKARGQIRENDLAQFDLCIEEVKLKAIQSVKDFLVLSQGGGSSPLGELTVTPGSESPTTSTDYSPTPACSIPGRSGGISPVGSTSYSLPSSSELSQIQLHTNPSTSTVNPETVASWEHLQEDLIDLNGMINDFAGMVKGQGEKLDKIEDNIEKTELEVQQGTSHLSMAAKYKSAIFPVAGAIIGGIVGGPVGLAAGIKLGSVAAVGGGFAGYFGGRALKDHQDKVTEVEMKNLSSNHSKSAENISS